MINEIMLLAGLELCNLYGINVFRHTKDRKAKSRYLLLMTAWVVLILMTIFYVGGLVYGLAWLGMAEIVPAYLVLISSLLVFVFDILKAGNMIFSKKGYDMLCALPVRTSAIVSGRFLAMYAEDLLLTFLVVLPGSIVYGFLLRPGISFYLIVLSGAFFIPMLPLVLATLIGTIILAISSRMKHKTLVQTLLMVGFVLVTTVGSLFIGQFAEGASKDVFADLAQNLSNMMSDLYPPAVWFGEAAIQGNIGGWICFIVFSVMAAVLMVVFVTVNFHGISRRLSVTTATHDYQMRELKSSGILIALYKREMKRYFSSSIYVMNTIIGAIMGLIMSIAICAAGVDKVQVLMEIQMDISVMIPYIVAGVFGMMTTTSVSISMEGKQAWIVKTLPVPTKMVLDSKILLNVSLLAPFYFVSEIMLFIAMKPKGLDILWLFCVPTALVLWAVVFGLTVNLHFYSFDWDKEGYVVKQSASAVIGGFAGMLLSLLCGGAVLAVPEMYRDIVQGIIFVVLLAVTIILYKMNNRIELQEL